MTSEYAIGDICQVNAVIQQAQHWQIDLAIIGPEAPLENGIIDCFNLYRIPCIGPTKKLAQIETSKAFARQLLTKYAIPGNIKYQVFDHLNGVNDFLAYLGEDNYVIKADGLAGGKGVKVAGDHLHSLREAYQFCESLHQQNQRFVIEEKCEGQEFSLLCFTDGLHTITMPPVQDHKRAWEGNQGPNTGGMGSYTDANHLLPFLSASDVATASHINAMTIKALAQEVGELYCGILYGGFIATRSGIRLIEFNARFGDPEAINLLTLLDSDFVSICQAMVNKTLQNQTIQFKNLATVCKYVVPEGYPDHTLHNTEIDLSDIQNTQQWYIASVNAINNKLYTTHSRAAAVLGIAETISEAEQQAENEIQCIKGKLYHRKDIGSRTLIDSAVSHMQQLRQGETA